MAPRDRDGLRFVPLFGIQPYLFGVLGILRASALGQCSKYCQVGVDVMAFAKNQESFDNGNSACIQCGICIDVCPMDVLEFSTDDEVAEPPPARSEPAAA